MSTLPDEIEGLYYKAPYLVFLTEIDVLFSGATYDVGYGVLNTDTGVLEFQSPSLPDCLSMATQSAAAIKFFEEKKRDIDTSFLEDDDDPEEPETIH